MKGMASTLAAAMLLAAALVFLIDPQIGVAQEPTAGWQRINGYSSSPGLLAAGELLEVHARISANDSTIVTTSLNDAYGARNFQMPPDGQVVDVDPGAGSYSVQGTLVKFVGLQGYASVTYRTSTGVERDGRHLALADIWWVTPPPFDLHGVVSFPAFYDKYVVSISPPGYTHAPGRVTWDLTNIDEWQYSVEFDLDVDITSVSFPDGNKTAHHTREWPDYVFRRVQWVGARVDLAGAFSPATDTLRWSVRGPNETEFRDVPVWSPYLSDADWAVRKGDPIGSSLSYEVFIPAGAPIGPYALRVAVYRNTGQGSILMTSETAPEFEVIFNPWNDDDDPRFDEDVYNPSFNSVELDWYANGSTGLNYYPRGGDPVEWLISPHDEGVFLPAIAEVTGLSSAQTAVASLVDKARWDDNTPTDSEVLDGRWGPGFYRADWRDVPAIMAAWDSGNSHPTGQCMDFGGLVSALTQSIGVPSRMLTCVSCYDPHNHTIWNFHVWNELWVNHVDSGSWSLADGTYGIGPATRGEPFMQEQASTSTGIYTYDANTGTRENVLPEYQSSSADARGSTELADSTEGIALEVRTNEEVYEFGDTVTITVTATNETASEFSGEVYTAVSAIDYSGAHDLHSYPVQDVTVPAGSTVVESYVLAQSDYQWNGEFLAWATLDSATAEHRFRVEDGLDLGLITSRTEAPVGQPVTVSLSVTNTLSEIISDLSVEVHFPPSAIGVDNPSTATVPSVSAGEVYTETWVISVTHPGLQLVLAYASSPDAGYDRALASFDALGTAALALVVDAPAGAPVGAPTQVTATVRNVGHLTATDVQASLSLSGQLSTSDSLTSTLGTLLGGQEKAVSWSVLPTAPGVHTLRVHASESSVSDDESADQLLVAVEHPHTIALSASDSSPLGPQPVLLTLENYGDIEDIILLDVASSNPNIGFTVYDNGSPLTGSVGVPAYGTHELSLAIDRRYPRWECGVIRVTAMSLLDPNACDELAITVSRQYESFVPIAMRGR